MSLRALCLFVFSCVISSTGAYAQSWTSLGPNAGEVPIVVVSPSQGSRILAIPGNDFGGLFLSTNSGTSWTSIAPGICDAHVTDALFHPTVPATIFAATNSAGVCRSTDGGATWTTVSSGLPTSSGFAVTVRAIAINPASPTTLLAGTLNGLYRSVDNGGTWTLAAASGLEVSAVEISPSAPATAYAVTATGVIKSIDSGGTWTPANTGLPTSFDDEALLTIDPANANIAFLVAGTVYKTSNGGTNWATSNSGLNSPFFFSNVAIDPNNSNIAYVNAIGGSGFSRSTDGGATWTPVNPTGLPDIPAFNVTGVSQIMGFEPGSSTNLYAGSPAGVFRSTNTAAAWTEITANMSPQRVVAPALQPGSGGAASSLLVSRATINDGADILKLSAGVLPFTSVTSPFTGNDSGEVVAMAVDPSDPNVIYLLGGDCALPYKSTNGGGSWTLISSGIAASTCGQTLTIDPSNPATLYIAMFRQGPGTVVGIYKSTNGGASWTASNAGITGGVNHVSVSATNSSLLYAGSGNQVFKSTNGGANWSNSSTGLPPGGFNAGVVRVVIDPTNDSIAYAATGAGVYRTTNGGTSWTARTSGWPTINGTLASVRVLAIDPTTPATLLAAPGAPVGAPSGFLGNGALGIGLYRSTDSGATWSAVPGTIAGTIVNDVVFDGTRAIFATTNNGVFKFAAALPTMTLDKSSLVFSAVTSGTAFLSKTADQVVRLTQTGSGTVTWTAASNSPWLTVSPTSGSGTATLTVSVQFASGLAASQSGPITITLTGASNTAGPLTVTLNTISSTAAVAPFGAVDTPTDGITGVAGSIAVTGWALDDIGTTRVRVMRSPVAGEGTADIFIGNAVFIDGARGDIQAGFPNFPLNSRAGWGYLLLTNFLPNTGNGTFTLKAFADDADGHTTLLGSKVITCDNLNSIAPFGAIDTPGQGETIGGVYLNAGWVLSPGARRADGAHGGVVSVFADGVPVGSPSGWGARSDIQALFPVAQYSGANDAVAGFGLDTTTMSNGVHSMFWIVTATSGGSAGVGSRYFTVSNGSLRLDPSPSAAAVIAAHPVIEMPQAAMSRLGGQPGVALEADALVATSVAIEGRRGFDVDAPFERYEAADGRVVVQAEELDRIELRLASGSGHEISGYLRTAAGLKPLPVGSALDRASGTFTWGAGPGFVGSYDLVFVHWSEGQAIARQEVRIVLNPKGSNRLGPQVIIDVPSAGTQGGPAVVGSSFFLSGWAADLRSPADRGVDVVHVWAYPVSADGARQDAVFLGSAEFGGARPDVAAVHGARFGASGYGLIVKGLAPGTYDVAVFAYSTVAHGFAPASIVRVIVR